MTAAPRPRARGGSCSVVVVSVVGWCMARLNGLSARFPKNRVFEGSSVVNNLGAVGRSNPRAGGDMPATMNFKPQNSARGLHANPGETPHASPEALTFC